MDLTMESYHEDNVNAVITRFNEVFPMFCLSQADLFPKDDSSMKIPHKSQDGIQSFDHTTSVPPIQPSTAHPASGHSRGDKIRHRGRKKKSSKSIQQIDDSIVDDTLKIPSLKGKDAPPTDDRFEGKEALQSTETTTIVEAVDIEYEAEDVMYYLSDLKDEEGESLDNAQPKRKKPKGEEEEGLICGETEYYRREEEQSDTDDGYDEGSIHSDILTANNESKDNPLQIQDDIIQSNPQIITSKDSEDVSTNSTIMSVSSKDIEKHPDDISIKNKEKDQLENEIVGKDAGPVKDMIGEDESGSHIELRISAESPKEKKDLGTKNAVKPKERSSQFRKNGKKKILPHPLSSSSPNQKHSISSTKDSPIASIGMSLRRRHNLDALGVDIDSLQRAAQTFLNIKDKKKGPSKNGKKGMGKKKKETKGAKKKKGKRKGKQGNHQGSSKK
ncbi:hypothetical protein ADUPG1_008355 [Aduncisulcus paluster]|uniref:Uncharacterized protein n=1 Tax=Aduncisulcus paluster TaxID=2918883 RepID=A0ABQ5KRM9_9EUKA|nr:hypothetical protein ADUPG1_008355 [Aduncisulcus paluster]